LTLRYIGPFWIRSGKAGFNRIDPAADLIEKTVKQVD
jgi:hypothetical protein